ncbi:MAG: hypothetical protein ACE5WD_07440 [Candidatus Aminicenantia bacterium]
MTDEAQVQVQLIQAQLIQAPLQVVEEAQVLVVLAFELDILKIREMQIKPKEKLRNLLIFSFLTSIILVTGHW